MILGRFRQLLSQSVIRVNHVPLELCNPLLQWRIAGVMCDHHGKGEGGGGRLWPSLTWNFSVSLLGIKSSFQRFVSGVFCHSLLSAKRPQFLLKNLHVYTYIYKCIQTYIHIYMHIHARARARTHACTYTHTHTHTYARARARTHT